MEGKDGKLGLEYEMKKIGFFFNEIKKDSIYFCNQYHEVLS